MPLTKKESREKSKQLIVEAKSIYNNIKTRDIPKALRTDWLHKFQYESNINSLNKLVDELKHFEKYPSIKITKKSLKEIKKIDTVVKNLKPKNESSYDHFGRLIKEYFDKKEVKIYNTGLKRNNTQDVMELIVKRKMTKAQIVDYGKKLQSVFKGLGGSIATAVRGDKWLYAGEEELDDDYDLYTDNDYYN
jgi:hypothetical protein